MILEVGVHLVRDRVVGQVVGIRVRVGLRVGLRVRVGRGCEVGVHLADEVGVVRPLLIEPEDRGGAGGARARHREAHLLGGHGQGYGHGHGQG